MTRPVVPAMIDEEWRWPTRTPLDPTKSAQAACRGWPDPNVFFPGRGDMHAVLTAKAICNDCSIRADCLEWALDNSERWGIWGGASERERRRIRVLRDRDRGAA